MRKLILGLILISILFVFKSSTISTSYIPIYMTRTELEKSVKLLAPRPVTKPGKIYVKENLLFIGETHSGVHVFDNTNPRNPENIGFIQIDGSVDIAIKNDILYADNAVDLIAIKLKNNITSIEVVERIRNVFPELTPPDQMPILYSIMKKRPPNSVIVGWKQVITEY